MSELGEQYRGYERLVLDHEEYDRLRKQMIAGELRAVAVSEEPGLLSGETNQEDDQKLTRLEIEMQARKQEAERIVDLSNSIGESAVRPPIEERKAMRNRDKRQIRRRQLR